MKANIVLSIVVAVLAAVAIGLVLRKPDTTASVLVTSPYAPGQFLAATAVEWTTLWDRHALTLDLSVTRQAVDFAFPEVAFVSICNDVLQKMPHAPNGVRPDSVYRVTFRKIGKNDAFMPFKVDAGRCVDWKAGSVRFPNYPPPLQDWELRSYEAAPDKDVAMVFVFASPAGTDAEISDTTFANACLAALTEPVLVGRKLLDGLEGKIARVRLTRERGLAGLKLGTWQAADFRIVAGACRPEAEGQKT